MRDFSYTTWRFYYAETFSKEFAVVSLPGAEQRSAYIYAALADHPRNAKGRRMVSRVFFLAGAQSVPSNGFAKLPDAEFGETLPLRPGG
jgi:hypothetical protein